MLLETLKFSSSHISLLDKECHGQHIERVLPQSPIVVTHINEDALFVCQLLVLLHFVV